jgi:hypothetical protein
VTFPKKPHWTVFTDNILLQKTLKSPFFSFVDQPEKAEILWIFREFSGFELMKKFTLVNHIPNEQLLVSKQSLSETCLAYWGFASWMPLTFNLQTQLPLFIAEFKRREKVGLGNVWIERPWNMARKIDSCVSGNLDFLIRNTETGARVVSECKITFL